MNPHDRGQLRNLAKRQANQQTQQQFRGPRLTHLWRRMGLSCLPIFGAFLLGAAIYWVAMSKGHSGAVVVPLLLLTALAAVLLVFGLSFFDAPEYTIQRGLVDALLAHWEQWTRRPGRGGATIRKYDPKRYPAGSKRSAIRAIERDRKKGNFKANQ